jgi:hypothetical protein
MAGSILWAEGIDIRADDFDTPPSVDTWPIVNTFGLADLSNPRGGPIERHQALIHFAGPSLTLRVLSADFNGVELPVPMYAYGFPSSSTPPQFTDPPEGAAFLGEFDIPAGDYRSSQFFLTFRGADTILFESGESSLGVSIFEFALVPEPSSALLLAIAAVLATAAAWIARRS